MSQMHPAPPAPPMVSNGGRVTATADRRRLSLQKITKALGANSNFIENVAKDIDCRPMDQQCYLSPTPCFKYKILVGTYSAKENNLVRHLYAYLESNEKKGNDAMPWVNYYKGDESDQNVTHINAKAVGEGMTQRAEFPNVNDTLMLSAIITYYFFRRGAQPPPPDAISAGFLRKLEAAVQQVKTHTLLAEDSVGVSPSSSSSYQLARTPETGLKGILGQVHSLAPLPAIRGQPSLDGPPASSPGPPPDSFRYHHSPTAAEHHGVDNLSDGEQIAPSPFYHLPLTEASQVRATPNVEQHETKSGATSPCSDSAVTPPQPPAISSQGLIMGTPTRRQSSASRSCHGETVANIGFEAKISDLSYHVGQYYTPMKQAQDNQLARAPVRKDLVEKKNKAMEKRNAMAEAVRKVEEQLNKTKSDLDATELVLQSYTQEEAKIDAEDARDNETVEVLADAFDDKGLEELEEFLNLVKATKASRKESGEPPNKRRKTSG
ncbi:hypothetical protein CC80DRAFT_561101 [Byssothecium circinans]|uniref:Uncharacterized protein n=1 Tax=Byssothecium circinans TaxID=147558 RepID=A0A6A5U031_9PLEO|nr:hypothetical protein CC80DRAFT_561101 [Byssothecium circinans]